MAAIGQLAGRCDEGHPRAHPRTTSTTRQAATAGLSPDESSTPKWEFFPGEGPFLDPEQALVGIGFCEIMPLVNMFLPATPGEEISPGMTGPADAVARIPSRAHHGSDIVDTMHRHYIVGG